MVHGLATWGMCLNLKAAENRIRAAWHAACHVEVFMMRGGAKWTFSDGCDMGDSKRSL